MGERVLVEEVLREGEDRLLVERIVEAHELETGVGVQERVHRTVGDRLAMTARRDRFTPCERMSAMSRRMKRSPMRFCSSATSAMRASATFPFPPSRAS